LKNTTYFTPSFGPPLSTDFVTPQQRKKYNHKSIDSTPFSSRYSLGLCHHYTTPRTSLPKKEASSIDVSRRRTQKESSSFPIIASTSTIANGSNDMLAAPPQHQQPQTRHPSAAMKQVTSLHPAENLPTGGPKRKALTFLIIASTITITNTTIAPRSRWPSNISNPKAATLQLL